MTVPSAPPDGAREALAVALSRIHLRPVNLPDRGLTVVAEDMADALLAELSADGYQLVKVDETWWQYGRREMPDAGEMVVFERRPVPLNGMQRVERRPVAPVGPWVPVSGEGNDG